MKTTAFLSLLIASASSFAPSFVSSKVASTSGLAGLSVTELKDLLTERGVDFRDCLEKRDLVERLEESYQNTSYQRRTPRKHKRGSLTVEEDRRIDTFKRVSPSVAFITTTASKSPRGFSLPGTEIPTGTGSGFLWDYQGHVVTNCHVIAPGGSVAKTVKVKLAGMPTACDAKVVGVEPDKDLAVLKIDKSNLPKPMEIGTSNDLQVGQSVLAIGNPFGLDLTLTTGVVSATAREIQGFGGRKIRDCVQTDAAINPGNSGGPLLDSRGRLIGVNTAIFSPGGGGGNVGIGFSIPVDTVRRVVNSIIRYGKVKKPILGVQVSDDRVTRAIAAQLRRKLDGVLIAQVLPNTPAAAADLEATTLSGDGSVKLGDMIVQVNGQAVKQVEDLLAEIEERKAGETVTLRIHRRCDPRRVKDVEIRLTTSVS